MAELTGDEIYPSLDSTVVVWHAPPPFVILSKFMDETV